MKLAELLRLRKLFADLRTKANDLRYNSKEYGSIRSRPLDPSPQEEVAFALGDFVMGLQQCVYALNQIQDLVKKNPALVKSASIVDRVAQRFEQVRLADQATGQRAKDKKLTSPINSPKGINRTLVKENGRTEDKHLEETATPDRKDIRPKDVFSPTPRSMNVLNFAETGKDQDKALRNQVPHDKGWDTVKNLSQYLIRTEGGGGTPPVGKK